MCADYWGMSPAIEAVLTGYASMVRTAARRRGLEEADVDEVMQEVRVRLWKALGSSERIAAVNTSYVYQAAMSAACDLIRKRRGDRMVSVQEQSESVATMTSPGPDTRYERKELGQQIRLALEELGANQRPVVRMYLAGYPQRQIQALLGWTEAKTRNVLYRGVAQLRTTLSRKGIGPGAVL
jgi:RNA polymerase sigma factor (sigma-70 family)